MMEAADPNVQNDTVSRIVLEQVRLSRGEFHSDFDANNVPEGTKVNLWHGVSPPVREGERVTAMAQFKMEDAKSDPKTDAHLKIAASFTVVYRIPGEAVDEAELKKFVELNALINVWPFWREFVDGSLARLRLPPFMVPLLRILPKKAGETVVEVAEE
jgi:hypothetical protein